MFNPGLCRWEQGGTGCRNLALGELEHPLHLPRAHVGRSWCDPRPVGSVLHLPRAFGGRSHLPMGGGRSGQRLLSQHGWDGESNPELGEAPAVSLLFPQLLGQPEPGHSFPPGEGAPTSSRGAEMLGAAGRRSGCGLIRGAPLCGRRLLSAACINHALQPFRRERHSLL